MAAEDTAALLLLADESQLRPGERLSAGFMGFWGVGVTAAATATLLQAREISPLGATRDRLVVRERLAARLGT